MIGRSSDVPGRGAAVSRELKVKFIRGVLMFYAVNLFALLVGVEAIEAFGNLEGLLVLLAAMSGLQVSLGYAFLERGKDLII